MQDGSLLAAIDLGSNSFRLEIGRLDHGQLRRVEYLKETVRQGGGLDESRNLSREAMERGWECLARFAERIAGFNRRQVRAVATQTLREARNRDAFLSKAQEILGHAIEVISGREEARLIYLGVAHLLPQSDEHRLVIDIGGRSTELILGHAFEPSVMESYRVGSVAWSMRYFESGQFTEAAFRAAEVAAKAVLEEASNAYPRAAWQAAYGSSGTIGAVGDVLSAAGWGGASINQEGLDWLKDRLLAARSADKIKLDGLKDDRRAVIGGGLAVLRAVFEMLDIEEMLPAQGALRHGALFDILDREHSDTDIRSETVERLARKFGADATQSRRVGRVACHLFRQLRTGSPATELRRHERKLEWAAQLHEIGSAISHADYHKHGAYILDSTDAPGFAWSEMHRLGLLVLGHRGKLRKLEADFEDELFVHQLMSLRLAVILCHARRDPDIRGLQIRGNGRKVTLSARGDWSDVYPQSAHLLRQEEAAWQRMPWAFELS